MRTFEDCAFRSNAPSLTEHFSLSTEMITFRLGTGNFQPTRKRSALGHPWKDGIYLRQQKDRSRHVINLSNIKCQWSLIDLRGKVKLCFWQLCARFFRCFPYWFVATRLGGKQEPKLTLWKECCMASHVAWKWADEHHIPLASQFLTPSRRGVPSVCVRLFYVN